MAGFTNRELLRFRMKAIPIKVRQAVAVQLEKNANELVALQKQAADASFADPTGETQRAIRQEDTSTPERLSRLIISDAVDEKGRPKANWIEHGTSETPAKPHFWPPYRAKKRAFKARVARAARKAMKDAIK